MSNPNIQEPANPSDDGTDHADLTGNVDSSGSTAQVPATPLEPAASAPLGSAASMQQQTEQQQTQQYTGQFTQPHTEPYTQSHTQQADPASAEPMPTAPNWAAEQPQVAQQATGKEKPLQARLGTIVWGVLLVAFAVIVAVVQLNPDTFNNAANTSVLVTAGLIGAGLLLVLAGIAAAVRKK